MICTTLRAAMICQACGLDKKIELDEYEKERINAALTSIIYGQTDARISITYFRPDERKSGGSYLTATGIIGKYDEIKREISFTDGYTIKIDDILCVAQSD